MRDFVLGVLSSVVATVAITLISQSIWPYLFDRFFYKGIRVDGVWDICSDKDGRERVVGKLTLRQQGSRLHGESFRTETRQGDPSDRRFKYRGQIVGDRLTLLFEDSRGKYFDSGTYVFCVHNDYVVMVGMSTFHGKPEGKIVAERRVLKKTAAPLPN